MWFLVSLCRLCDGLETCRGSSRPFTLSKLGQAPQPILDLELGKWLRKWMDEIKDKCCFLTDHYRIGIVFSLLLEESWPLLEPEATSIFYILCTLPTSNKDRFDCCSVAENDKSCRAYWHATLHSYN